MNEWPLLFRSTAFSLMLHASAVGVMCLVPLAVVDPFASRGKQRVVAIELTSPVPASVASTSVVADHPDKPEPPVETPTQMVRDLQEAPNHDDSADPESSRDPYDLPDPACPPINRPPTTQRPPGNPPPKPEARLPEVQLPEVKDIHPKRPRQPTSVAMNPTAMVTPIQQTMGTSDKTPADLSSNPPPAYPSAAVGRRAEGTVTLRLKIDAMGKVRSVDVVSSSGHAELDQAAIDAVSKWRGKPARRFGHAISCEEILPIRFRL